MRMKVLDSLQLEYKNDQLFNKILHKDSLNSGKCDLETIS